MTLLVAPGELYACQFLGLGTSTHDVHDQLLIIISSSGMVAMLGMDAGP
jgi:hypothetical protein